MTINYTTLLGLAQPVTGTEQGTWGDTVNDQITALIEEAVAGGESINVTAGNVTLTDTAGQANQARNAILVITGTPGTTRNVVAPSQSKAYIIVNNSDAAVVIKGSATTGVTIAAGARSLVAWNGSDFVEIGQAGDVDGPSSSTDNAIARFDGTTGKLIQNSVVTIADSTGDISGVGQLNATTADLTNLEVTNIKAKDGTAAATIADSTGKITVSTELAVDNLNLSGNTLSSTDTNGNIVLAPNGTGDVQLDADTVRIGDSNANATLTTNGTGDLVLNTNSGTNSGSITLANGANGNITIAPNGTGDVYIDADTLRVGDAAVDATIQSNGNADLILKTGNATTGTLTLADGANGNLTLALNGTGQVVVNAGAVGTPTIAPTGDLNTGIYFPAANTLSLVTDGADRVYINSSGNVGIGTTGPQAPLDIRSAQGTVNLTAGSDPVANLHILNPDTTIATGPTIVFSSYYSGTNSGPLASIAALRNLGTDTSSSALATNIVFSNARTGSLVLTEAMRIDSSGNVGIGTSSPDNKLVVYGNTGTPTVAVGDMALTQPYVYLRADVTNSVGYLLTRSNHDLAFGTNAVERMRIDTSGNVSIKSGNFYINSTTFTNATGRNSYLGLASTAAGNLPGLIFAGGATYPGEWTIGLSAVTGNNNLVIWNGANERMRIDSSGNVGIGTTAPTNILSLGGNSARTIWMERHTTSNTAGNNLTIQSGGATSGATDKNGGSLLLQSGTATGSGSSIITFSTATAGGAGTTDRTVTEKMRIDGAGNVGIGTSSPQNKLQVFLQNSLSASTGYRVAQIGGAGSWGTDAYEELGVGYSGIRSIFTGSSNWALTFATGTSTQFVAGTQAERMRIDSSGNVQIATTTNPLIWFNNTAYGSRVTVEQNGAPANASYLQQSWIRNSNDTEAALIGLAKSRGTTTGSATIVASGDPLGTITFQGADGTNYVEAARISAVVDGTPGANDMPGSLVFSTTADGAATTTERMRIDSSGNVGIAVTPSAWGANFKALQLNGGAIWQNSSSAGNTVHISRNIYYDGADYRYIATNTAQDYALSSGGTHNWYSAASGTAGNVATLTQVLAVGKGVTLALEGANTQNGAGITFPAAQSASSDANTLDDYEQGTWTPTIIGTGSAGTGTYTIQVGRYTKIGNQVTVSGYIDWTAHTGTTNMQIAGLPFTSLNVTNAYSGIEIGFLSNIAMTANYYAQGYVYTNATTISLVQTSTGGSAATSIPIDTAGTIIFTATYFTE